jgi:hypothetical protein
MRPIRQKAIAICRERAHTGAGRVHADVESGPRRVHAASPKPKENQMQNLSPRHVKTEEALRLGVLSGWYSTKVSGTFVSGPHASEADCLRRIAEINPPPPKKRR